MSPTIRIPFRSRGDALVDVGADARHLPDAEDREVVRALIGEAHRLGDRTAGQLLDHLQGAAPAERRALVNLARTACGLGTIEQAEAIRVWEAAQPPPLAAPPRDERGFSFQLCHEEKCSATPIEPSTGLPAKTPVKRWWCPDHRHLAADGDMDDYEVGFGLILGPAGVIDLDEREREATIERERQKSREARREARRAEKVEIAAQRRADEKALCEQLRRETPPGFPT